MQLSTEAEYIDHLQCSAMAAKLYYFASEAPRPADSHRHTSGRAATSAALYYSTAGSIPVKFTCSFADCLKSTLGPCLASGTGRLRVGAWVVAMRWSFFRGCYYFTNFLAALRRVLSTHRLSLLYTICKQIIFVLLANE